MVMRTLFVRTHAQQQSAAHGLVSEAHFFDVFSP